jgi:hypothetical protein
MTEGGEPQLVILAIFIALMERYVVIGTRRRRVRR